MNPLPRILVFSLDVPHTLGAGPVVLYRLFEKWPSDRLLVAGSNVPAKAQKLSCEYIPFQPRGWRLEISRFNKLSRLLTLSGFRSAFAPSMEPLKQFKPEVVVMVMQNLSFSEMAYRFSLNNRIPLVIIVHDDPEDFERCYAWAAASVVKRNKRIYRHAVKRLCVSPEMRDLLRERYGADAQVLYPSRSDSLIPRATKESLVLKDPGSLTIGYAGTWNYGYGARLEELIPVFQAAGVRLRVYSKESPRFNPNGVITYVGGFPTPEMVWEKVKAECDAVILPYCYATNGHQNLYRTHFPSKLAEYLALGMPVIIGGPEYATGVKWGLQNPDASVVITTQEHSTWIEVLKRVKSDGDLRLRLSNGAIAAGDRDFDPFLIRSTFTDALCSAAELNSNNDQNNQVRGCHPSA